MALVPIKHHQLSGWQTRNPGALSPAQYTGPRTRRRRLYTAQDIRTLRAALVGPLRGSGRRAAISPLGSA
jgi:hypothetical protein